jgi:hypothetical protein
MTTRRYGTDLGTPKEAVTETVGTTPTRGMELQVDTTKFRSRHDVLIALRVLSIYIAEDTWPPA